MSPAWDGLRRRDRERKRRFIHLVQDKLHRGLPLSIKEYDILFKRGNFSDEDLHGLVSLFTRHELENARAGIESLRFHEQSLVEAQLDIWVPSIEVELLDYVRRNPDRIDHMSSRQFEEFVAALFRNQGFAVELTPQSRDGGIDLIAVEHSAYTGQNMFLVECKKYDRSRGVGVAIVQRMLGVVAQLRATKGIIVTTSFFTRDALKIAEDLRYVLTLQDYEVLVSWLSSLKLGPQPN